MIGPMLRRARRGLEASNDASAELVVLPNRFFGPRVRVSGLLTGVTSSRMLIATPAT